MKRLQKCVWVGLSLGALSFYVLADSVSNTTLTELSVNGALVTIKLADTGFSGACTSGASFDLTADPMGIAFYSAVMTAQGAGKQISVDYTLPTAQSPLCTVNIITIH